MDLAPLVFLTALATCDLLNLKDARARGNPYKRSLQSSSDLKIQQEHTKHYGVLLIF